MTSALSDLDRGSYPAKRAAALSGVPLSTVYYWSRHGPVRPSVSPTKEKLWSYGDLIRLRTVYWLRQRKDVDGREVARTTMDEVRRIITDGERAGYRLWAVTEDGEVELHLLLGEDGRVYLETAPVVEAGGQGLVFDREQLDLLGPFVTDTTRGPNLVRPGRRLRIVPGKCAGEPHLVGSRLETRTIMALSLRGFPLERIQALYPDDDPAGIEEALRFEQGLTPRLERLAA